MALDRITSEMLLQHPVAPDGPNPDLRYAQVLAKQVEALREQPRETWPSPDAPAGPLRSLGAELKHPGWYDLARLAYLEAIDVYREDVATDHLDDYRHTLWSLGRVLVELRRYEDALPILQEERLVSLRLAVVDGSALDLADDARTTSIEILVRLGRHGEALDSAAEAVREIRQQSAGRRKDHALAYALGRFADRLAGAGRFDEAVDAAAEAEKIWRRYNDADDEPDWNINTQHGKALERLSEAFAQVGRYEEAYAALVERVEMRKRLVDADDDFNEEFVSRGLAITLNNVALDLGRLGRHHEARATFEEAVSLDRALAARALDRQHRFERLFPDEEDFLDAGDEPIGRELFDDGGLSEVNDLFDDEELDEEFIETIEFDDQIRDDHLTDFRTKVREADLHLCVSLYNLGSCLHGLNRLEEALAADSEAAEIARRHQGADSQLALALNNRACVLADLGRHEEALEAVLGAVNLLITLAATDPEAHERTLALALHTLSVSASGLNPHEEVVLTASLQCLALYRRLYRRDPHRLAGDLACALADHGLVRSRRGEHAEALAATAESVEMYRRPATRHPARYNSGHAHALLTFAEVRTAVSEAQAEGRAAAEEAVALLQSLAATVPEAYEHRLSPARSVLRRLD
ncbi:tetratricopeptide repeat protein [Nonomuraea sp. NN258]|uniref:tetratricopeptide repeat protein n=1 Tax=Nonomuraea antri TaxID=2730852 RepID=UPI001569F8D9|nr:tetratricopeptide repeat protein [Nonomuraea antri]NRQ33717.1 tetratricopeptide repeat protein [Nonomuraea antri]